MINAKLSIVLALIFWLVFFIFILASSLIDLYLDFEPTFVLVLIKYSGIISLMSGTVLAFTLFLANCHLQLTFSLHYNFFQIKCCSENKQNIDLWIRITGRGKNQSRYCVWTEGALEQHFFFIFFFKVSQLVSEQGGVRSSKKLPVPSELRPVTPTWLFLENSRKTQERTLQHSGINWQPKEEGDKFIISRRCKQTYLRRCRWQVLSLQEVHIWSMNNTHTHTQSKEFPLQLKEFIHQNQILHPLITALEKFGATF